MMRSSGLLAVCSVILIAYSPTLVASQRYAADSPTRRLEIAVANSDEFAESVLTVQAGKYPIGVDPDAHAKIVSILLATRQTIGSAQELLKDRRTRKEGRRLMKSASELFREVREHFRQHPQTQEQEEEAAEDIEPEQRDLVKKKYSNHDLLQAQEDDERALDISRRIYETMITFPECVEHYLNICLQIINDEIGELGLATIEVVVHEKRNADQEGYNKVVIVTNALGDQVKGRAGDGVVTYPFLWNDAVSGQRLLGSSGTWGCLGETPEQCCQTIKLSVPNKDVKDNNIECHIFVPFGGATNARRSDRVLINLSPDGRVQEAPIIQ